MAKKRLARKQKGYETYKKNAGKVLLVASFLGLGFVAASLVNIALMIKAKSLELAASESKDMTPFLRETVFPDASHAFFLLFFYLAIMLCVFFFVHGKAELKRHAFCSLILSCLFGLVRPALAIRDASESLKENMTKINEALTAGKESPFASVREYLLKSFIPTYAGEAAIILILLGILLVAVYFLTGREFYKQIGLAKILVGGIFGAMGRGLILYDLFPRIKETTELVQSYIAAGQNIGYASVEEFVGKVIVPVLLDHSSFILLFAATSLLAFHFIWKTHQMKSAGCILAILGAFLAAFNVFLSTSFDSMKLSGEILSARQAIEGAEPFTVTLGEMGLEVSSMLGYFTRKFIPYYLDQFSMGLFYVSIIILALYVMKKEF